jgi:hypothetical protein
MDQSELLKQVELGCSQQVCFWHALDDSMQIHFEDDDINEKLQIQTLLKRLQLCLAVSPDFAIVVNGLLMEYEIVGDGKEMQKQRVKEMAENRSYRLMHGRNGNIG